MNANQHDWLRRLADGLDTLQPRQFDAFGHLSQAPDYSNPNFKGNAIAWLLRFIPEAPLSFRPVESNGDDNYFVPVCNGQCGTFAVMELFGITMHQTRYILGSRPTDELDIKPQQMADKIRRHLLTA